MHIRYGYDIALELVQPMTILAMMDVHSDFRCCMVEETEFEPMPVTPAKRFVDDNGSIVRRLSAPAGVASLRLQGLFCSDGRKDEVDSTAQSPRDV